jgi:hypothetical protein
MLVTTFFNFLLSLFTILFDREYGGSAVHRNDGELYQAALRHIQDGSTFHSHRRSNLKSYNIVSDSEVIYK